MISSLPLLDQNHIDELIARQEVLLIDKPWGYSSHYLVNGVRQKTGVRCVGHAGTLDPLATGLMIILVGRNATKLQDHFLHLEKSYEFTAELGKETDTFDSTGTVTKTWVWEEIAHISRKSIEEALKNFIGEYDQEVPAFSAVKVDGRALYVTARRGKTATRPSRRVKIISLKLDDFSKDVAMQKINFSCRVHCGSGTYVRSLAVDIGRALGVGATITSLRRTHIGRFHLDEAQQWIFAEQHKPILEKSYSCDEL